MAEVWAAVTGIVIGVGSATYAGVSASDAASAQAAQANAAGAFSDYQNKLSAYKKMTISGQIMEQANEQTRIIRQRAQAEQGTVANAESASGGSATYGSARHAAQVVETGTAATVASVIGSAINKSTAETNDALNNEIDGKNAITRSAAISTSLDQAGTTKEIGSILSGVGTAATQSSKAGFFSSSPGTTPVTPGLMADNPGAGVDPYAGFA